MLFKVLRQNLSLWAIFLLCPQQYIKFCAGFNLTIVHNNDFHTHFAPVNINSSPCKIGEEVCFGGVARTVSMVKQIRNENNGSVLFLNAGDHYQGTVWYTFLKWEGVAKFVKLMKHDMMALGNHEFDDGVEGLVPFVRNVTDINNPSDNLPILAANINATGEPRLRDYINKSMVVTLNERKIGIIGYITPETTFLSRPGSTLIFNDEIESIQREIEELKRQYTDLNIFIAVGHSGLEKDKEIASKIPDLDVVVGGHSHSFLYTGTPPSNDQPVDTYPVVFDHADTNSTTLVVQAFAYGKYLGKLDLNFDNDGKIVSYTGQPILLNSSIAEDNETLAEVQAIDAIIKERFGEVIGATRVELLNSNCRNEECNLGNLIADSLVYYYIDLVRQQKISWTSNPIALMNGGGIRSGISVGNITTETIMSVTAFGNQIGFVKINGSLLWKVLEHSVSVLDSGRFLQVSGLRVTYNIKREVGNRVLSVRVRCGECATPRYEDLMLNKTYGVLLSDYIAQGGDGYDMLVPVDFISAGDKDFDVFSDYVKKYSPILIGLEDRIVFTDIDTETTVFTDTTQLLSTQPSNSIRISINRGFILFYFVSFLYMLFIRKLFQ